MATVVGEMVYATAGATIETLSAVTDVTMAGDPDSAFSSMTDIITVIATGSTAAQSSPAVATGGIAIAAASTGKPTVCPSNRAHHFRFA